MARVFQSLGIYGLSQNTENLLLQSLVTGDPLLMIGKHGSAKTACASAMAKAIGLKFQDYDASKSMFEDMLGMPNPKAMQNGRMEYIEGPMTLWDKKFLFIDEVNRAAVELQSKWLEVIRSRKVMGFDLEVKFIWGAMNPMGYEGTQVMDEAYSGRFSTFVYIPSAIDMEHEERTAIINSIGIDDAPALGYWINGDNKKSKTQHDFTESGVMIKSILRLAQEQYAVLMEDRGIETMTTFLSKFAKALYARTASNGDDAGVIELDGRRLGMMRRSILATRAIELANAQILGTSLPELKNTARYVVVSTIPTGVNAEGGVNKDAIAHIGNVFDQLADYFDESVSLKLLELNYELMVSNDIIRKAEILLNEDIKEITKNSAWTKILEETGTDISVLALIALNLEVSKRGTIPANVLDQMVKKLNNDLLKPTMPKLSGLNVHYYRSINDIINKCDNLLERVLVFNHINEVCNTNRALSQEQISNLDEKCENRRLVLRKIMRNQ